LSDIQKDQQFLAKERTDLAQERTVLASERTFSAWLRTGLTAMATGIGIARLLDAPEMLIITSVLGTILILIGGGIYVSALWRYFKEYRRLKEKNVDVTSIWLMSALVAGLLLTVILALVIVIKPPL
jgi:putative membrane protein